MLDAIKKVWEVATGETSQITASATTFALGAIGYFNYPFWHDALSLIGMAAGAFSCVTLGVVNLLRAVRLYKGGDDHG